MSHGAPPLGCHGVGRGVPVRGAARPPRTRRRWKWRRRWRWVGGQAHVFVISSCSDLSSACWRSSSRSFFHLSSFCSSFCCSCSASQTFSTFLRLVVCHDFLERKESDLRQGAASGHRERAVRMNARTRAAGAAGRASRHRAVCLRGGNARDITWDKYCIRSLSPHPRRSRHQHRQAASGCAGALGAAASPPHRG